MVAETRACLMLLVAVMSPSPVRSGTDAPKPLGRLIDVGGYRVHLFCTGAGSPTVVIAGAGYSFDWGLVQPKVSAWTRVCAYDHSGAAWSEAGPPDSCPLRVRELHAALEKAGIEGPYVLVGHSLGALVSRLYVSRYPADVAGLVFVDHALPLHHRRAEPAGSARLTFGPKVEPARPAAPRDTLPVPGPESDPGWKKLPAADYALHRWADSLPGHEATMASNGRIVPECLAEIETVTRGEAKPLGERPLIVLRTSDISAATANLDLLSARGKEEFVTNSGHVVMVDRPDAVVDAIHEVVDEVRSRGRSRRTAKEP